MKRNSDDGCSLFLSGILLLVFLWVLTRIVNVFNPEFLAHSQFCCIGASLLMFFMLLLDYEALEQASTTLRNVVILLVIALFVWMLAAPAKTLGSQIHIWLGMHPYVGLTLLAIACLGQALLPLGLSFLMGPSSGRNSRTRYDPNDYSGYDDT